MAQPPMMPNRGRIPQPASVRLVAARQARRPAPTAFPLLPALAAAFILLGAAQLGFWWWEARLPGAPAQVASNPLLGLFRGPEIPSNGRGSLREPQRVNAAPLPQNLQFGDAMARVTVTIYTDPSCGACRERVRELTAGLPIEGVRQVYKFWPADTQRMTPGILVELARRSGTVPAFWRSLQGAGSKDLDDGAMLEMLDQAGIPLTEQRSALVNDGANLMMALEDDIQTAREARLPPPPVIVVENYVLDGTVLTPEQLPAYVKRY